MTGQVKESALHTAASMEAVKDIKWTKTPDHKQASYPRNAFQVRLTMTNDQLAIGHGDSEEAAIESALNTGRAKEAIEEEESRQARLHDALSMLGDRDLLNLFNEETRRRFDQSREILRRVPDSGFDFIDDKDDIDFTPIAENRGLLARLLNSIGRSTPRTRSRRRRYSHYGDDEGLHAERYAAAYASWRRGRGRLGRRRRTRRHRCQSCGLPFYE
jgi:hypothetical protein